LFVLRSESSSRPGSKHISYAFTLDICRRQQWRPIALTVRKLSSSETLRSFFPKLETWTELSEKQSRSGKDKKQSNRITGLDKPRGLQEVEPPRFQDSLHMKVVRLSALLTGRIYPPPPKKKKCSCYPFLLEAGSIIGP
jgi:hypothetical protein